MLKEQIVYRDYENVVVNDFLVYSIQRVKT